MLKKKFHFEIATIIWDVNIWETTSPRQMKLNRFNVEQNKIYSSKFEWEIQCFMDFMNNFTSFQYMYHLWYNTHGDYFKTPFFLKKKNPKKNPVFFIAKICLIF